MLPTLDCAHCGKAMEFEVRVLSLSAPALTHCFFSCPCGHVASQTQTKNEERSVNDEIQQIDENRFRSWATRTKPPVEAHP
jgi:hypothetical protein